MPERSLPPNHPLIHIIRMIYHSTDRRDSSTGGALAGPAATKRGSDIRETRRPKVLSFKLRRTGSCVLLRQDVINNDPASLIS